MTKEEQKLRKKKALIRFALFAAIGVLIIFSAIGGALYSCSDGFLLTTFKCVDTESLGYCSGIDGNAYIDEEYYKELNPDGTLSDKNYTKADIEALTE